MRTVRMPPLLWLLLHVRPQLSPQALPGAHELSGADQCAFITYWKQLPPQLSHCLRTAMGEVFWVPAGLMECVRDPSGAWRPAGPCLALLAEKAKSRGALAPSPDPSPSNVSQTATALPSTWRCSGAFAFTTPQNKTQQENI